MAVISTQDIARSGTVQVTVSNPSPGGGTSAAGVFTIANAAINPRGVLNAASYTQAIVPRRTRIGVRHESVFFHRLCPEPPFADLTGQRRRLSE
jgi:hypothetical protein